MMSPRLEDRHQGGVTDEFWFHSEMKVFLRSINQEEIKRFTLQSDCYPAKKVLSQISCILQTEPHSFRPQTRAFILVLNTPLKAHYAMGM